MLSHENVSEVQITLITPVLIILASYLHLTGVILIKTSTSKCDHSRCYQFHLCFSCSDKSQNIHSEKRFHSTSTWVTSAIIHLSLFTSLLSCDLVCFAPGAGLHHYFVFQQQAKNPHSLSFTETPNHLLKHTKFKLLAQSKLKKI